MVLSVADACENKSAIALYGNSARLGLELLPLSSRFS